MVEIEKTLENAKVGNAEFRIFRGKDGELLGVGGRFNEVPWILREDMAGFADTLNCLLLDEDERRREKAAEVEARR